MIGQNQTPHLCLSWSSRRWEIGCKGFACKRPPDWASLTCWLIGSHFPSSITPDHPGCDTAMAFHLRACFCPLFHFSPLNMKLKCTPLRRPIPSHPTPPPRQQEHSSQEPRAARCLSPQGLLPAAHVAQTSRENTYVLTVCLHPGPLGETLSSSPLSRLLIPESGAGKGGLGARPQGLEGSLGSEGVKGLEGGGSWAMKYWHVSQVRYSSFTRLEQEEENSK